MTTIGRYQITGELGQGGMGLVYRAVDPSFSREVAVKVLPQQFASDASLRARFEREAHVIAALEHPAIVPVYDFGEHAGQPFLVMRFMAGGSLSSRLANGPLTVGEVIRVLERLTPALDMAHQRGVIHRDLKPANILFDSQGSPYIADFGIAKIAEATVSLTSSGIIGTPAYMSPEQAQGAELDGRSDIYALGVMLFEMLTGRQPYQASTPVGLAMKHVLDPIPRLHDVAPHLPLALDQVIQQAMAKQPNERYATAGALVAALQAAAQFHAAGPYPQPPATRPSGPGQSAVHPAPGAPRTSPRQRAWPIWGFAGLLLLALVLLAIGIGSLGGKAEPSLPPPTFPILATTIPERPVAEERTPQLAVAPTATGLLEAAATPIPTAALAPAAPPPPIATSLPTATPAPTDTPTPPPTPTPSPRYLAFSLESLANADMTEGYVDPPLGRVTLEGVPFDLGAGRSVTTQASSLPDNPTRVIMAVDVAGPLEVALLLTGGNMDRSFQDKRVGLVRLAFDNGAEHQVPLVAGQNLREWKLAGDEVVTAATSAQLLEVWRGGNTHNSGVAVIDLLRIPVPPELQSRRLTAIEVRDLSLDMLDDLDPAINWLGVSVLASGVAPAQATARQAVNLRSGPDQDFEVIRLLPPGEIVRVLGRNQESDWLQVTTAGGETGWAFAQYMDTGSVAVEALPIVAVP